MLKHFINILKQEIYNAEIDLIEKTSLNDKNVKPDILFNGYAKKDDYIKFCQLLIESINFEIENELRLSVSRNKALFYIKSIKMDFINYKNSFSENKAYELTDTELMLYQHLKNTKSKLPEEFIGIKKRKYLTNNNISYSDKFKSESDIFDRKSLNEFENTFASIQLAMIEEISENISKFELFIENITEEEFQKDKNFFEHKHPVLTLSEDIKLTDKEVDIKIDTLDKRQTVLFFHYLERAKLILEYTNTDKATFAHYLSGHVRRQLQQLMGETSIRMLKLDVNKPNEEASFKYENLNVLKEQLKNVIEIIENDIELMEEG